jgi:hypothetical protein
MKTLWLLITALPDLIRLLQAMQKAIDQTAVDRKVKDDLKSLHEAFNAKDAAKINAIFNS